MRIVFFLFLLCVVAGCRPNAKPGTASGTKVLDWSRGPVTFSTGVSLGKDVDGPVVDRRMVTFTPRDRRDESLGLVRLDVQIERGDVQIEPNAQGERPAEKGTAPRRITASVVENHGWTIAGTCEPHVGGPGAGEGPRAVTFYQRCQISLSSDEDTGTVILSVTGEGKHQFMGSFGEVKTIP